MNWKPFSTAVAQGWLQTIIALDGTGKCIPTGNLARAGACVLFECDEGIVGRAYQAVPYIQQANCACRAAPYEFGV